MFLFCRNVDRSLGMQKVEIILAAEPMARKSRRNPIAECIDRSFPSAILMISPSSIRARTSRACIFVLSLLRGKMAYLIFNFDRADSYFGKRKRFPILFWSFEFLGIYTI